MAQNSQPLELAEALVRLFDEIPPKAISERLALTAARGRFLAADVVAPLPLPPFPASAMDGYALRAADWRQSADKTFRLVGESRAGHPWPGKLAPGECVRIFTGASVPAGADQVIVQEELRAAADDHVTFAPHEPAESYVRPVGHDVAAGAPIAARGERLTPMLQGALASAGATEVEVYARPRVGVFSTGDELVDPGKPLAAGQIYDSNRLAVVNLLASLPVDVVDLGRLADDPDIVREALTAGAAGCDVLLTSGGVSVGDADFIAGTIGELGKLEFWKLNLKPGKPLAFGRINDCVVFGLPGNPVSTIVTFLLVAKPAILHLCGAAAPVQQRVPATLTAGIEHTPGRAEYQRGQLQERDGALTVSSTGDQSSNRLSTFRHANCLIEVPGPAGNLEAGQTVRVIPFHGLLA